MTKIPQQAFAYARLCQTVKLDEADAYALERQLDQHLIDAGVRRFASFYGDDRYYQRDLFEARLRSVLETFDHPTTIVLGGHYR